MKLISCCQWFFFSLLLLISGCHTASRLPYPNLDIKLVEKIIKSERWKVTGIFSITHNGERITARFLWSQYQDNYQIEVFSPLSMENLKIIGDSSKVELQYGHQRRIAKTFEELVRKQLGYPLSIVNLNCWLFGLSASKILKNTEVVFNQYYFHKQKELHLPKLVTIFYEETLIKIKINEHSFQ